MGAILTLAAKDLRILSRDRFALFWVFAFPLLYALFFGAIFHGSGGGAVSSKMTVSIVDEDGSVSSKRLVEHLAGLASIQVSRQAGGESAGPLATSLGQARDDVRKGRSLAYLRIPRGFGRSPFAMFQDGGKGVALQIGIDPSHGAEAGYLQGMVMKVLFQDLAATLEDRKAMQQELARTRDGIARSRQLKSVQKHVLGSLMGALERFFDEMDFTGGAGAPSLDGLVTTVDVTRSRGREPRTAFDISFPSAMIWGLMSVAIGFAIMLVKERTRGTLLRLRIAPVGRARLLAGKGLGCFLACLFVMVFLAVFGRLALGVRFDSPALLALAMASTAACFTGLMMTVSVLGKTEQAVAGAAWGLMMPLAMIGGGMIPLIAMPSWLARLSNLSPFKWGIESIEGAVWRGFTLADMLIPCAILIAVGGLFFGFGVVIFCRIDR